MSVEVVTFGCRLNACESEVIAREASAAGLSDTVVINSCAVTAEAVAQARQTIRRVRRARPEARIVVTGCAAQTQPQMFAAMGEVDRVVGNDDKLRRAAWRRARAAFAAEDGEKVAVGDVMAVRDVAVKDVTVRGVTVKDGAPHPATGARRARPRALVQAQNGCDHRCTFCIIPFGRGHSRSVPIAAVVAEARARVAEGCGEIVLTGVDLTAYGADLPGALRLSSVVREVLRQVPELRRLRISSIDSIEADAELLELIANEARLMPHLHLSLQSGDDLILKRMKRRHRRADAIAFCAAVRRLRPGIALGADIIAGFPTETEAAFARSEDLIGACGLTFLHVFPFSPREGTPASRMPQLAPAVIKARAHRLRASGEAALVRRLDAEVGAVREVLVESATLGRSEHYLPVAIAGGTPGTVRRLVIAGHDGRRLIAA